MHNVHARLGDRHICRIAVGGQLDDVAFGAPLFGGTAGRDHVHRDDAVGAVLDDAKVDGVAGSDDVVRKVAGKVDDLHTVHLAQFGRHQNQAWVVGVNCVQIIVCVTRQSW